MLLDLSGPWHTLLDDTPANAEPHLNTASLPTMQIPQNWFLGGLDHHGVVWFRRTFQYPISNTQYQTLCFSGTDYFADVYLNGKHLGRHEGYFEPFSFDVTGCLVDGENVLAVRVDSPHEKVGLDGWHMRKRLIKGVLNHHDCRPGGGWLPAGQSYNTGGIWNRVYLLEHGPITIESVHLRADLDQSPPILYAEVLLQNRGESQEASLTLHISPDNFGDSAMQRVSDSTTSSIHHSPSTIHHSQFEKTFTLQLSTGLSTHALTLPVPNVALWNPWDRGFPHLYQATLTLQDSMTELPITNYQTCFGFRTIRVDSQFNWTINGHRYFPRASNYIASQWLSETLFPEVAQSDHHPFRLGNSALQRVNESANHPITQSPNHPISNTQYPLSNHQSPISNWFTRDLFLARAAHLNFLRVHAHVLPQEFYEAADRAGILIWQDFPFQWGYQDTPEFHAEAERQMKAMVHLLSNHPSIAAWCIHNESPWDAEWMAQEAGGTYDPTHNRALDEKLETIVKALDPTRYVHQNSGVGDGHVYPGWYYGDWNEYADVPGAPFPTEYGAQALPDKPVVLAMFPDLGPDAGHADLVAFKRWQDGRGPKRNQTITRIGGQLYSMSMANPRLKWLKSLLIRLSKGVDRTAYHRTPTAEQTPPELHPARDTWLKWRFHDFQPGETFTDDRVTLGNSLDDFIASSQAYQAWVVQYATEAYRRHKYSMIKGIFHFMLTDPWPAITWAVVDYFRQPKPGYDALRRAMQPVLPTADVVREYKPGPIRFDFYVVNDLLTPIPDLAYAWHLTRPDGERIATGQGTVHAPSDGVTRPVGITTPRLTPGRYRLTLQLSTSDGAAIAGNFYDLTVTS